MGAAAPPSPVRRDARRAAQRMARHLDGRGRVPPRELGRQGLPARHRGRGDPAPRTDRRDRRRLRRDHLGALVQGAGEPDRSPRRARALCGDAVRPAPRARLREHLARQDAARDGPALLALTCTAPRPPTAHAVLWRGGRRGRGHRHDGGRGTRRPTGHCAGCGPSCGATSGCDRLDAGSPCAGATAGSPPGKGSGHSTQASCEAGHRTNRTTLGNRARHGRGAIRSSTRC